MSGLIVKNLSAMLGGNPVLQDVGFQLLPGETVSLLGPNGAGKSTLMRCIAGLLPHHGTISWQGTDLGTLTPVQRARLQAFLPQERVIHWDLLVHSIVSLARTPYGSSIIQPDSEDDKIVYQSMETMQVKHLAKRQASTISGGELARVLAARLIAQDTPLIVADEPAANLDPAHQIRLMGALRQEAARGKAVLVSLHDIELAARWSNRVIILKEGRIIAEGKPEDAITETTIAKAYGIKARIKRDADGLCFTPVNILDKERTAP